MTCQYCEGIGMIVTQICAGDQCQDEHDCRQCTEKYDADTCTVCDGTGEISEAEARFDYKCEIFDNARS